MDCVGKKQRVPGAVAGHTDDKEHVLVGHFGTLRHSWNTPIHLGTSVYNSLVQYIKPTSVHLVKYTLIYTSVQYSWYSTQSTHAGTVDTEHSKVHQSRVSSTLVQDTAL